MTLQVSGPIKMSEIKAELSTTSNSLITYGDIIGIFSPTQVKMSDFYGKTHCVTVQVVNNVVGSTDSIRINDCDNDSYMVLPANYPSNYTLCVNYNRRIPDSVGGDATITLVGTECFTTTPTAPSPAAPSPATPSPAAPTYRTIQLGNPPGDNNTAASCAITSGLTKFISYSFAITNGLVIYDNPALSMQTYNNDPYSGNYAWLYDTNAGFGYAVTFDSSGVVATVYDCIGGSPVPPSPSPAAPSPAAPSPSPAAPPPASNQFTLNSSAQPSGFDACTQYNSFSRASYYQISSTFGVGTLYNDAGLTSVVADGYYSNGSNYYYYGSGTTSGGTTC